jgi:hypothetical protein
MNAAIKPVSVKPRSKKAALLWSAIGVGIVGAVVAGVLLWPKSLPAPADTAGVLKLASTDRWSKLTSAQLDSYFNEMDKMSWEDRMKAMREVPEAERRDAMRNFWESYQVHQARKYVAMTPEEQRKELDRQIDEQEKARASRGERGPTTRPGREGGPGGGPNSGGPGGQGGAGRGEGRGPRTGDPAARQKERLEDMPPGDRAAMTKYRADMRERRIQRGLPEGGRGGPGR